MNEAKVQDPYQAIYGQIAAADLGRLYNDHSVRLFAPNIRMFLGNTEANNGISEVLSTRPQDSWYFNNGVTALCRTVGKKPIGGDTRESGTFSCEDLKIVNGAQTVGSIANAGSRDVGGVEAARVSIRIVALENAPDDFDKLITRYNNTQNRIDRRDFVALDAEQERLRAELLLDGVLYAYKSGESIGTSKNAFDLVEATVARACQETVALSVQAKREIGLLWDDITRSPYKTLFNSSVAGPVLWRAVQVVRTIEQELQFARRTSDGRYRLLAVNGNRITAHLVLRDAADILDPTAPYTTTVEEKVAAETRKAYRRLFRLAEREYPDAYLASVFRNQSRCQHLVALYDRADDGTSN